MTRSQRVPSGGGFGGGSGASREKHQRQLEQQAQRSLQAGDWMGAERAYRWLFNGDSANPSVYTNLAALLAMQKRTSELEPLLRQAIALQPKDPVALNNLGQVLVQRGALEEAEASFDAAVELDGTYPEALTNLANLRFQRGALYEAIDLYKLALAVDPNYLEAQWNLAHPLLLLGDYRQGFRQYEYRSAIREAIQPHSIPSLHLWDGAPLPSGTPLELLQQALQVMEVAMDPMLEAQLLEVNGELWQIEDAIRDQERKRCFDQQFIDLARSVYRTNDRRAAIKREINERYGSTLIEQKSYNTY